MTRLSLIPWNVYYTDIDLGALILSNKQPSYSEILKPGNQVKNL